MPTLLQVRTAGPDIAEPRGVEAFMVKEEGVSPTMSQHSPSGSISPIDVEKYLKGVDYPAN